MRTIAALLIFLYVTAGAHSLTATLADGPVTITTNDHGGFEKVAASIPTAGPKESTS